jgi:hypothetical protein
VDACSFQFGRDPKYELPVCTFTICASLHVTVVSEAYISLMLSKLSSSDVMKDFENCIGNSDFLATDPEARVRFPALPEKEVVVGLERGPLSLVSGIEGLLDRKIAAPV